MFTTNVKTEPHSMIMKTIIVGDSAIGKSSLFDRLCDEKFLNDSRYASTIGVDFKVKLINTRTDRGSHTCKLQIWDTAGQERFKAITQSYYRGTHVCIVCFDTSVYSGSRSLTSVMSWITDVRMRGEMNGDDENSPTRIYVVGLKSDQSKSSIGVDILNDSHFRNLIEGIERSQNTKFVGICSSRNNTFTPYVPLIATEKERQFMKDKTTIVMRIIYLMFSIDHEILK
ncbi:Rab family, other [Yasminevirus sp. GU-2018]|uniref:Rab family, other n=1 Tax=Yasminevirus sp. GU-2018 TaxID=2420051 RepID=A0A5K0U9U4_9VIRU|nr:Rab family, other [Yasminevirus sp. GU-2018]